MEDTGIGGGPGGARGNGEGTGGIGSSSGPRWVAPVDPITGLADTRLCFLYADMWRRVLDPGKEGLEPLVGTLLSGGGDGRGGGSSGAGGGYIQRVAPEVYDAVLSSVLSVVKKLDLRYETSEEGGR